MKQTIIFDGDDTLWKTQPIFKSVIDDFYSYLQGEGFAPDHFRSMFGSINKELLTKIKLSSDRLSQAMTLTYKTLCQEAGQNPDPKKNDYLHNLGQEIYKRLPVPIDGVEDLLRNLKQSGFDLLFYSAGNEATQVKRLVELKLDSYFTKTYVVSNKDPETLAEIIGERKILPENTWMVGNSPKFDINPALQVGLNSIWLYTSFWKEELEDIQKLTYIAFSLPEVHNIILNNMVLNPQANIRSEKSSELLLLIDQAHIQEFWIVGNSPKNDINPALFLGINAVWIPDSFDENDIEPFLGMVYVAFSNTRILDCINSWVGLKPSEDKIIWRIINEKKNPGDSLIVD